MRLKLWSVTTMLAVAALAWSSGEIVLASGSNCAGTGHFGSSSTGPTYTMSCTGTCLDQSGCTLQANPGGPNGGYFYCGCPDEGEEACCHVVKYFVTPPGQSHPFGVAGDCPSCPLPGVCRGQKTGSTYQALCD